MRLQFLSLGNRRQSATFLRGFSGIEISYDVANNTIRRLEMPKYVIERDIPGAGKLTPEQLQGVADKSCGVLKAMGPQIQWVQSYVTGDKITCVYIAPNADLVREHARKGGFPANRVEEIRTIIDPTTAEEAVVT
jgi:hypothetical protein